MLGRRHPRSERLAVREGHEDDLVAIPLSFGHLGMLVCRQQPPAVLGEDGHECRDVPLVPFAIHRAQRAYTSIAEARALGIEASEVLKTVAMRVAGGYALMAVPATGRLGMHLAQAAVGDRHVRLATEQELRRDFPGIELGALPPLGSLLGAPLYVDQEVLQHETVVFAAGSQTESVQLRTADLLQHEQVTTLPLIKHADGNDKDWLR